MNPTWLLFILPLASAAIIQLGLKRKADASAYLSTASVILTFIFSLNLLGGTAGDTIPWITVGNYTFDIGFQLDQLSTGMMIVVTGIGMLVHIFSLGYMKDDEAKARYFSGLSIFMFSMTGIVLASNFIMMFIFWELVGLSSYLLIGHWYQKDSAADAAKKAFLTNRIGDFGFMIGILMLWGVMGTLVFSSPEMDGSKLTALGDPCLVGSIILLIFCGAIGKSAQLPLHVWLPDAMEGPTPVSALIHAATMVAAGVYMMARLFLSITPEGMALTDIVPVWSANTIAWVGGLTALLAALMATQQNDIKKILAYSTLSQLGYMVMAVGLLAPESGMFHLFTHAWFKALLFLGSGAVIYACHHEQDIWKMGGLWKKMPITGMTFLIGTAALTAVPFTSGFYSKEGILHAAVVADKMIFFLIAVGVAALTTFYMLRLFFIAFLGKPRAHGAEEAKEAPLIMTLPLMLLGLMALVSPFIVKIFPVAPEWNMPLHYLPSVGIELICSLIALILGAGAAYVLYFGKDKDPIHIPLFENKFYLDEIYSTVVKVAQDCVAMIIHFIDEFVIDGLIVGGLSRCAAGTGNFFRRYIQDGSLSHYAALMAVGVLLVIYFTVFA
ncbi:NADH-quinone oxidoreductase subunit L [Verrucomicrobiaceae bacterium N1E253]|uniref:NADH-quinone oxidoreductase subunit L n=1 Tax=Oceaniferula marina TaxID=2748318 RepID=A0A851G8X7_9BACT|nr:NADH-quinone oxidoreductase subunit L [Oceaniferula marina]NWK54063.1 NADH-quinone oxidoreductase subunit L [Oceaniferula marina]